MSVDITTNIKGLKISSNKSYLTPRKTPSFSVGSRFNFDGSALGAVIIGTVKEKGEPVSRRVFCYSRNNGVLAAATTSDVNGDYRLSGLALNPDYYVVSLDENGDKVQYNAVIQDLIRAKKVAT